MKQLHMGWRKTFAIGIFILGCYTAAAQNNVGIGTSSPNSSARLDVSSTTQGLLLPRMTQAQRDAITTPATGLIIYQTNNTPGFYYYTGAAWQYMDPSGGGSSSGGVNPFGDGAGGPLTVSGTVDLSGNSPSIDLNKQFSSVTISGNLTIPSGTKIRCSGNVSITGNIIVKSSPSTPRNADGDKGIALSKAVPTDPSLPAQGISPTQLSSLFNIPLYGGGSGAGSNTGTSTGGGGGGSFAIYANGNIIVGSGAAVIADGENASTTITSSNTHGGGGGGGGLIVLMAKGTMTVSGTLSAKGGRGGDGLTASGTGIRPGGGGGGGGVICLISSSAPSVTGSVQVNGGAPGSDGTGSTTGNYYSANGGASGGNGGSGSYSGSAITQSAGSTGIYKAIVTSTPENML